MTAHAFSISHCRVKTALSVFLSFLLLLPTLIVFAHPLQRAAIQARPALSPPSLPAPRSKSLSELKVGDVIRARNSTGKVAWKQVTHSSKRTVASLLSVQLINVKTHKAAETLVCPLDEPVRLTDGRTIPAGRLAIGKSIIPRAGPICKVKAMFLLRKPGGFLLCDVRIGPLSAAQSKQLAIEQSLQPQPRSSAILANSPYADPMLSFASYAAAANSGGTVNPFLFQGQQYDPASGDYYLRARYYDPILGRFLSQDRFAGNIADPVSLHRYLYANNDPINYADPSGNESLGEVLVVNSQGSYLQQNNASTQIGAYSRVVGQITGRVPVYPQIGIGTPGIGSAASPFIGPIASGAASSLFQRIVAFGLVGTLTVPTVAGIVGAGVPNAGPVEQTIDGGGGIVYLAHGTTRNAATILEINPPMLIPPGYNTSGGGFFTARDDGGAGREYAEDYAKLAASSPARQGEGGPALLIIGVPTDVFLAASPAAAKTVSGRRTTEYGFLDSGPRSYGFDTLVQQWS